MNWLRGLGMLALGLPGACAEVVIVPDDGGGGSGGAAPSPSTTAACEEACANFTTQCGYEGGSCIDQCLEGASYLVPCAAQYEALLRCGATVEWLDKPECAKRDKSCAAESEVLRACIFPTGECEMPTECVAGRACTTICGGVSFVALCSPSSGGWPMSCTCQIDGKTVGSCQNVSGNGTNFWGAGGCCNVYFAEGP